MDIVWVTTPIGPMSIVENTTVIRSRNIHVHYNYSLPRVSESYWISVNT